MKMVKRALKPINENYFLFGPRGTGKSTWLNMTYADALKVDLLDSATCRAYGAHPERLADFIGAHSGKSTVIVDEIQKVPEMLDVIHQMIESRKDLQFVLTGSSARKLRKAGTNLLGGRAAKLTMPPFTAPELGRDFSLDHALKYGMLPVVWGSSSPRLKLEGYLDLYIKEEVQTEGLVRNLASFTRFLEMISFSHGSQLSISTVARDCGVSRMTVDGYVNILYALLMATLVPVFTKRAKRELAQHGKFYFFDTGVWRTIRPKGPLDSPAEIEGAALEGLVFQHLKARMDLKGAGNSLYFWRTRGGVEVDFVVYSPDEFKAIEVKNAAKIALSDISGLREFKKDYPEAETMLVYRGRERILFHDVLLIPAEEFLLETLEGVI